MGRLKLVTLLLLAGGAAVLLAAVVRRRTATPSTGKVLPLDPRFVAPDPDPEALPGEPEPTMTESGVLVVGEVIAEARDDGMPVPEAFVADAPGEPGHGRPPAPQDRAATGDGDA